MKIESEKENRSHNSCFNILADLVELRAIIINPFSQNYSAIKSASILKQRDVSRHPKKNPAKKTLKNSQFPFLPV